MKFILEVLQSEYPNVASPHGDGLGFTTWDGVQDGAWEWAKILEGYSMEEAGHKLESMERIWSDDEIEKTIEKRRKKLECDPNDPAVRKNEDVLRTHLSREIHPEESALIKIVVYGIPKCGLWGILKQCGSRWTTPGDEIHKALDRRLAQKKRKEVTDKTKFLYYIKFF